MKKNIVFKTSSLRRAFDKLDTYELLYNDDDYFRRCFLVRLELRSGVRRTLAFHSPFDAKARLLGYYHRFVSLFVEKYEKDNK